MTESLSILPNLHCLLWLLLPLPVWSPYHLVQLELCDLAVVVVSHFAGICQHQLLALCLSFHRRLLLLLPLLLLCLSKVLVALKVAFWNRWGRDVFSSQVLVCFRSSWVLVCFVFISLARRGDQAKQQVWLPSLLLLLLLLLIRFTLYLVDFQLLFLLLLL